MTTDELTEWGTKERTARLADLAEMHAQTITLDEVQSRAKKRRNAVGLSMNQAARALNLQRRRHG